MKRKQRSKNLNRDDAWEHRLLTVALAKHTLGKPNLRSDVWGKIVFPPRLRSVPVNAVQDLLDAVYMDGWSAGFRVGTREERAKKDASPQPLTADAFANEESIDIDGNRIKIGDRVESLNDPNDGVVIALAFDIAMIISDYDDNSGTRGNAFYCNCRELRLKLPVDDIRSFVERIRQEAARDSTPQVKAPAELSPT